MKAKNNKDVRKSIIQFSYYLIGSVFISICIFSGFMKTSSVEIEKIQAKAQEYDQIQMKQIDLSETMDTLLFYTSTLVYERKKYNSQVYNMISDRKQHLLSTAMSMNEKDCRLYKNLAVQMNMFLSIKDSIFRATVEEETVRLNLLTCISDNKKVKRRISVEGNSLGKK